MLKGKTHEIAYFVKEWIEYNHNGRMEPKMAKKVTDKDTKQTTKATNENIMNSDQMKEHLDNLVDMAKKNDNTLIDTEIVNYFVGKPDIELNTDMMTKIFDYLDEHHVAVLSETEEDDEILDDMILEDAEDADIDIEKIDLCARRCQHRRPSSYVSEGDW